MLIAAQQLLELSAGTSRTRDLRRKEGERKEGGKWLPPLMNGFVGSHSLEIDKLGSGLLNGESRPGVSGAALCVVDEEGSEAESKGDRDEVGGKVSSKAGDSLEVAMDTCEAQSKSVGVAVPSGNGAPKSQSMSPSGAAAGHTHVQWREEMELGSREDVLGKCR